MIEASITLQCYRPYRPKEQTREICAGDHPLSEYKSHVLNDTLW